MEENKKLYGTELASFAFFLTFVIYVALSFIGMELFNILGVKEDSVIYVAVSALYSVISLRIVIAIVNVKHHERVGLFAYVRKFNPVYVFPAILLSVGMFLGLGFINPLIEKGILSLGGNVSAIDIPLENPLHLVLFIILFAVLPAVEEECFFRGLLLENIGECGKLFLSSLIVALFFSLYHGSPIQLVYQFIYGIFLSLLALKSGGVLPSIIAHFINNCAIIMFEYFDISINLFNPITIVIGAVVLVGFLIFTFLYGKKFENIKFEVKGDSKLKDFFFPFGILSMLLCLILVIGSVL